MSVPLTTAFAMILPSILLLGFGAFFAFLAYYIFSN